MKYKRTIFILILLAAIIFFAQRITSLWDEISSQALRPDPTLIILSLLLLVVGFSFMALIWWFVLRGIGMKHSLSQAFNSFSLTQLTKYLPGSVWPVLGRAALLEGKKSNLLAASIAEMILKVIAALALSLLLIDTSEYLPAWLIILLLIITIVGTSQKIILPLIKMFNRVLGKARITIQTISQRWLMSAMITSIITWVIIGFSYALFINAFTQAPLLPLIGAFALAWTIGFLVIPVPAGLGVREAVLVFTTTPFLTEPTAIILALAARVWWMIGDLLFFLVGLFTRNISSRKNP